MAWRSTRRFCTKAPHEILIYAQVLKFSPHEIVAWVQYAIHSVPEALLVFGLCRAPTESWTAKLLTHPLFLGFVPYTFAAYIIHFPVLLFAQFVRIEGINSLRGLFRRVYRHKNCYESDWLCGNQPVRRVHPIILH